MLAQAAERTAGFVPIGEARHIYVDGSSVGEVLQCFKALRANSRLPGNRPLDARYRSPGSV